MSKREAELLRLYVRRHLREQRRHQMRDVALLREYVRTVLAEDEAGGNTAMGAGGDLVPGMVGPYGISFGSKNDLINTFITPFLDVANTAIGKSKEIVAKAKTVIKVALGTVVSTFIPGLAFNYKKMFEQEKKEIDELRKAYGEVYKRTDEALASNDAAALAFMAFPGQVLGAKAGQMAPGVTLGLMSAVSGGMSDKVIDLARAGGGKLDDWLSGGYEKGGKTSRRKGGINSGFIRSFSGNSYVLYEKDDQEGDKNDKEVIAKLTQPEVLKKMFSTGDAKKMQQQAREIYRSTLENVIEKADEIFNKTKTFEDIMKYLSKMKNLDADKKKSIEDINKLEGEEKQQAAKTLIENLRTSFKEFYVKNLSDHVAGAVKAGIPEDCQYVKDYKEVIQKIKSM